MGGKSSKQKKNKNKENAEENNVENPAAEQKAEDKVEASGEGESKPADGAAPATEEKSADGATASEDKAADGDAPKETPAEEAKAEDGGGGTEVTLKWSSSEGFLPFLLLNKGVDLDCHPLKCRKQLLYRYASCVCVCVCVFQTAGKKFTLAI